MEPGESVEETCVREVHEEAGVHIDPHRVSILTTPPWPLGPSFSSQLMIGCISHASDDNIRVNKDEIEDAKWFDVEMVRNLVRSIHEGKSPPKSPPLAIPSPWAIAFHLIEHVCSQR
jgi:NAD+ diphosphatase